MKVIRSIPQLRRWVSQAQRKRKVIGFVPTMGALHAGHISLVHQARRVVGKNGLVAVSIFVNPTQFNQKSDFLKYPKPLAADAALCRSAGVDLIFAPTAKDMYPSDFSTWVEEKALSLPLCGKSRPGHFRGVCTVVLKLFNLVQPYAAIFGQKDAQQAAVICRMARDLNIPIQIITAPIVRVPSGLAMSSRNQRLSPKERLHASTIYRSLQFARTAFYQGVRDASVLKKLVRYRLTKTSGLRIDYLELVNPMTLKSVSRASRGDLFAIAVWIGKTRLIDNISL